MPVHVDTLIWSLRECSQAGLQQQIILFVVTSLLFFFFFFFHPVTSVNGCSAYPQETWPLLACYQNQNQKQFSRYAQLCEHTTANPYAETAACQWFNTGCAQQLHPEKKSPQCTQGLLCAISLHFTALILY